MSIYDASRKYIEEGTPLIVLGGKEYGSGSSRDWAAKGTALLGVRAVLVESFERIHRSNLIGMGVLPLQFKAGESVASLGLTGRETFEVTGIEDINSGPVPQEVVVTADGREFRATVRIDTPGEAEYYRHGGIMQYVLRMLRDRAQSRPARDGERARAGPGRPLPVSGTVTPAAGQLSHLEAIREELVSRRLPAGAHDIPPEGAAANARPWPGRGRRSIVVRAGRR